MRGAKRGAVRTNDVGQLDLAAARAGLARSHDALLRLGCGCLQQLQRRGRTDQVFTGEMEVSQRGADVAMTKQSLDGVNVDPAFQQMRGKSMAQ